MTRKKIAIVGVLFIVVAVTVTAESIIALNVFATNN